jgi:hypothetical protein
MKISPFEETHKLSTQLYTTQCSDWCSALLGNNLVYQRVCSYKALIKFFNIEFISWWKTVMEKARFGGSGVNGRIILRWIVRKWNVGMWIGQRLLTIRTVDCHL